MLRDPENSAEVNFTKSFTLLSQGFCLYCCFLEGELQNSYVIIPVAVFMNIHLWSEEAMAAVIDRFSFH